MALVAERRYAGLGGSFGANGQFRLTERIKISGAAAGAGVSQLWSAEGLPWIGKTETITAPIQSLDARGNEPEVGARTQDVTFVCAEYSNVTESVSEGLWYLDVVWVRDPLYLPLERKTGSDTISEIAWVDQNGNKIIDSAGTPFADAITVQRAIVRYELTRRLGVNDLWDSSQIPEYVHHVNTREFLGFIPGAVYCADIRESWETYPKLHRVVTGVFLAKDDYAEDTNDSGEKIKSFVGWKRRIVDAGPYFLDSDGRRDLPKSDFQVRHNGYVFLDGTGKKLDMSLATVERPKFKAFDIIPFAEFDMLGFFS